MMSDSTSFLDELAKCVSRRLFYAYSARGRRQKPWPFMNRHPREYCVLALSTVPMKAKGRKRPREFRSVFEEESELFSSPKSEENSDSGIDDGKRSKKHPT
jgi:hypothetical protein